jgi:hypothetical protein
VRLISPLMLSTPGTKCLFERRRAEAARTIDPADHAVDPYWILCSAWWGKMKIDGSRRAYR